MEWVTKITSCLLNEEIHIQFLKSDTEEQSL